MQNIIISGGGTGGHIYPALAIGEELLRQNPNVKIYFIGAIGRMEMDIIAKHNHRIIGLWISGWHRKQWWRNSLFFIKLLISLLQSFYWLIKIKPQIVVGVGGYASGAVGKMAQWLNIDTVILEVNSYPGMTNKLLSKKAKKIFVAHNNMDKYFNINKILNLGSPLRHNIQPNILQHLEAYQYFELSSSQKILLIVGGSLGAKSINQNIAKHIKSFENVQLLWQTGKLYFDAYKHLTTENIKIHPFIDRMDFAYSIANVVVARAGAMTIAELTQIAKPTILCPSPNVAEDHQTHNAMSLSAQNACLMVKDNDDEKLIQNILSLLEDTNLQDVLVHNIRKLAKPNARKDIAKEILTMIKH